MADVDSGLRDIAEIRSMMERSTKFLSLSGYSGIGAGLAGLSGAWAVSAILGSENVTLEPGGGSLSAEGRTHVVLAALGTLVAAFGIVWFFSRKVLAARGGASHGPAARYLTLALAVPLVTGGCVTAYLLFHGLIWLACPMTLLFYGLGLFSAGTFTFGEVRSLGMLHILLGLCAMILPWLGLYFWGAGFGLAHIAYGVYFFRTYRQ
jgi:hypothetical protein